MADGYTSSGHTHADEPMETFRAIERIFKNVLTGTYREEMLTRLQSARRLVELAINKNPDGDDMLVCANVVMLHLREQIEHLLIEHRTRAEGVIPEARRTGAHDR